MPTRLIYLTVDETEAQIQKGRDLLEAFTNEVDNYERASHDSLAVVIENDATPAFAFLDLNMIDLATYQPIAQTVRQYIAAELRK